MRAALLPPPWPAAGGGQRRSWRLRGREGSELSGEDRRVASAPSALAAGQPLNLNRFSEENFPRSPRG